MKKHHHQCGAITNEKWSLSIKKASRSSQQMCYVKKVAPKKIHNFHRKTPVLESLFSKVAGLRPANLLKRDSNTGSFL